MAQELNQTDFEFFVAERCRPAEGHMIKLSDLHSQFQDWLPATERRRWTKQRMGKSLPVFCVKGRIRQTGQFYIGNIAWLGDDELETLPKLVMMEGFLGSSDDN